MNNTFFTSDTHFMHGKILEGDPNLIPYGRPFDSIEEHDEILIENWNKVVKPNDTVFHLGDFALGKGNKKILKCYYQIILHRLNGKKHLIVGNHDGNETKELEGWDSLNDMKIVKLQWDVLSETTSSGEIYPRQNQKLFLCHYPMSAWAGSHYDGHTWHLHGHMHGTHKRNPNRYYLDVGVDCWNFTPIEIEQIRQEFKKIRFKKLRDL